MIEPEFKQPIYDANMIDLLVKGLRINGLRSGSGVLLDKYYKDKKPCHIISRGGKIYMYENNLLHRDDAPAVITASHNLYFQHGKLHRENGPAVTRQKQYADDYGYRLYFIDDKQHRIDGPAAEYDAGRYEWWVDGNLHRLDGPAIIQTTYQDHNDVVQPRETPILEYWINGIRYSESVYFDLWSQRDPVGFVEYRLKY